MTRWIFHSINTLALFASIGLCSCESDEDHAVLGGSIGLNLTIPVPNNVNVVMYELSHLEDEVIYGTVAVDPSGKIALRLGELAAGDGYVLKLTAGTADGLTTCKGDAVFEVLGGQIHQVDVVLACGSHPTPAAPLEQDMNR